MKKFIGVKMGLQGHVNSHITLNRHITEHYVLARGVENDNVPARTLSVVLMARLRYLVGLLFLQSVARRLGSVG